MSQRPRSRRMPTSMEIAPSAPVAPTSDTGEHRSDRKRSPFSERVRKAMSEASLSISEVAHQCDVTPQAVSNIVNPSKGRRVEGCRFANKLAKVLGVSVEWMLYGEGAQVAGAEKETAVRADPYALSLRGLSPLQAGALHSLSERLRANQLTDAELIDILQRAHGRAAS